MVRMFWNYYRGQREGHPRRYMIGVPVPMQGTAYIFDDGTGIERIGTAVLVIGDTE